MNFFFFFHAPVPLGLMLVVSTLQFAPTYHDYVLYSSQEGDDGTTKYRSRTFVPTGHEMDAVRRNRHMFGNKIDDIQLSSVSSGNSSPKTSTTTVQDSTDPEAMKSSLLMDTSSSPSKPYDLSIIDMDLSSYPAKVPAVDSNPDTRWQIVKLVAVWETTSLYFFVKCWRPLNACLDGLYIFITLAFLKLSLGFVHVVVLEQVSLESWDSSRLRFDAYLSPHCMHMIEWIW